MKTTSCGILVLNAQSEMLLCHATGTPNWDIPKGGQSAGESAVATAIRETEEETGLVFEAGELLELGRFPYRADKDLYLFAVLRPRLPVATMTCTTHFRDTWGRDRPEMDGYAWTPFADVPRRCAKRMAALLAGPQIALPQLLQRLMALDAP